MKRWSNQDPRWRVFRPGLLWVAVVAAGVVLAGRTAQAGPTAVVHVAKLSPPVIAEPFTVLPCPKHPQATLELEGCAEQQIVRTDKKIDDIARAVFSLFHDDRARADLIAAQRAWLAYRLADCVSVSDKYENGTFAGVVAAYCTADRSNQRLQDLHALATQLQQP